MHQMKVFINKVLCPLTVVSGFSVEFDLRSASKTEQARHWLGRSSVQHVQPSTHYTHQIDKINEISINKKINSSST